MCLIYLDAAGDVVSVALLPGHIQRHERDEHGELHEEVDDDGEAGVDGERVDSGHVVEAAEEEAVVVFKK